jgi:DNA-binding transcriptional ArsR family regulator
MGELRIASGRGDARRREELLEALADSTSRRILALLSDRVMTAPEVADATDVPLSTVYRKVDRLAETPLLEATYRIGTSGRQPRQYHCPITQVTVDVTGETDAAPEVEVRTL